jgi:hypothetical protein
VAKNKDKKSSGGNRKKGRAARPGQSAKRARGRLARILRKIKHVKRSNGLAFFKVWEATRLPELRAYQWRDNVSVKRSKTP